MLLWQPESPHLGHLLKDDAQLLEKFNVGGRRSPDERHRLEPRLDATAREKPRQQGRLYRHLEVEIYHRVDEEL